MPEPLSPKIGFGMKVAVLPLRQATFFTMYLKSIEVVGRGEQRVELVVDLGLAGGAHLVVLALDLEAGLVQLQGDLGTQVGEVVDRRDREVTALVADLVAAVVLQRTGVPGARLGVDVVEGLVRDLVSKRTLSKT